ncbi:hypothetical protein N9A72_00740 [bacterium]|nr:hypothetical protein [bacterium]
MGKKMKKRMRKRILLVILFLLVVCWIGAIFAPHTSFAGIVVNPVRKEVLIPRGGRYEGDYQIWNNSMEKVHVIVKPREWFKLEKNKNIDINSWLEISPQEFNINPGGKKQIHYKVVVPEVATGELAAMISFSGHGEKESMLNVIFSVPLYVMIEGTRVVKWKINKVDIKQNNSNLRVAVVVENKGNIHLRPKGTVVIKNKKNVTLKEIELNSGLPVYPGKKRAYFGDWNEVNLKAGKYIAEAIIDYGNPKDILKEKIKFKIKGGEKK